MSRRKLHLPECGIYVGSAIYISYADYTVGTGRLFTTWVPENHDPEWYLEKTISENQGNLVQLWPNGIKQQLRAAAWWRGMVGDNITIPSPDWKNRSMLRPEDWPPIAANNDRKGEGMYQFVRKAGKMGLSSMLIYGADEVNPAYAKATTGFGDIFLGHDLGEVFTFRFDTEEDALVRSNAETFSLTKIAETFMNTVKEVLEKERECGYECIMSTGVSFAVDYEIAAGLDIPVFEDYAENTASALCRGTDAPYDLPAWGTHMNHEWHACFPTAANTSMETFATAVHQIYVRHENLINECGNGIFSRTSARIPPW